MNLTCLDEESVFGSESGGPPPHRLADLEVGGPKRHCGPPPHRIADLEIGGPTFLEPGEHRDGEFDGVFEPAFLGHEQGFLNLLARLGSVSPSFQTSGMKKQQQSFVKSESRFVGNRQPLRNG